MGSGDFFGEIGILNLDRGINRYEALLITRTFSSEGILAWPIFVNEVD